MHQQTAEIKNEVILSPLLSSPLLSSPLLSTLFLFTITLALSYINMILGMHQQTAEIKNEVMGKIIGKCSGNITLIKVKSGANVQVLYLHCTPTPLSLQLPLQ